MSTSVPSDEAFVRQIAPVVTKTLANEFADLPGQAAAAILRQTLATCLIIRRKATKQRLNPSLFARRVTREQVLSWLAADGSPAQQTSAMSRIMAENREAVARYLAQFRFRTTDVADEVLNDSFAAFFTNLADRKPVEALLSTCLISIARFKALHQLRQERTDPVEQTNWLETTFLTVDEADMGTMTWPLTTADDEPISIDLPVTTTDGRSGTIQIEVSRFRTWLADCFSRLGAARQLLFRLRYKYWSEQELKTMSMDEVQAVFDDLDMTEIAARAGYTNAHTASVRLNESRSRLRDCLTEKMKNAAL
ncbi:MULTISPECIES: sigma-70 RNA polymerase sigma factor region 4 domain-containing protein [Spirosoma]|uniref:Sigma-70 family RNA polymerase sigma factor n=1 Tax=Spirosoma sordidisoli TaxID=2502893 RepID=A0A4Q2UD82_9BACT|nr:MULTISPECIES: sigma-70 family RNA polymerase sigma factor [Spirosoma]RYC66874.1 sigma-70 family RNA polymerase sigma factor [Spirosoma sordidisoli]